MTEYKHIMLDDGGLARIGRTRYKVKHLAAEVRYHGWSPYELLWQHPDLTLAQIYSALAYYADHQANWMRPWMPTPRRPGRLVPANLPT